MSALDYNPTFPSVHVNPIYQAEQTVKLDVYSAVQKSVSIVSQFVKLTDQKGS